MWDTEYTFLNDEIIWRSVLNCFPFSDAFNLDAHYGTTQRPWLLQERLLELPGRRTWEHAAISGSVALLFYLMDYRVPCPDLNEIIQYSADTNLFQNLLIFLYPQHKFYDLSGQVLDYPNAPSLDIACKQNNLEIVKLILSLYSTSGSKPFLLEPLDTITEVLAGGHEQILRVLVPRYIMITTTEGLNMAARNNHVASFVYALNHVDTSFIPVLTDDIYVTAAQYGHVDILKAAVSFSETNYIPKPAFSAAFRNDRESAVVYILTLNPGYLPSDDDILHTCKNGHCNLIMKLPAVCKLPEGCLAMACKSKSSTLVQFLHKKLPEEKFRQSMLWDAVNTGNTQVIMAVFEFGKFTSVSSKLQTILVANDCRDTLEYFHKSGVDVYNNLTLIEACRLCNIGILEKITASPNFYPTSVIIQEALGLLYLSSKEERSRGFDIIKTTYNQQR
jgi:hypothetical protein